MGEDVESKDGHEPLSLHHERHHLSPPSTQRRATTTSRILLLLRQDIFHGSLPPTNRTSRPRQLTMANLSAYVPSFALPHLSSTSFADVWGFVLDPFGFGTNQSNITTLLSTSASQPVRTFVQSAASTAPPSLVENASDAGIFDHIDGILQRLANFDGVFNYVGSRWALSTIVLVCLRVTIPHRSH